MAGGAWTAGSEASRRVWLAYFQWLPGASDRGGKCCGGPSICRSASNIPNRRDGSTRGRGNRGFKVKQRQYIVKWYSNCNVRMVESRESCRPGTSRECSNIEQLTSTTWQGTVLVRGQGRQLTYALCRVARHGEHSRTMTALVAIVAFTVRMRFGVRVHCRQREGDVTCHVRATLDATTTLTDASRHRQVEAPHVFLVDGYAPYSPLRVVTRARWN